MRKYLISFLLAFICGSMSAQSLTVEAPKVVSMDETFRVVFTSNGNMSDFEWAASNDFDVVWGPQKGSMSSTSIVNGKRESSHTETYTYLLQPKTEGSFSLPAAKAEVERKDCVTKPFTIEVVKASASSGQVAQGSSNAAAASSGTVSGADLFLKLTLSKTNVVKGEPINAELKLYTKVDLSNLEDITFPTFNGFWNKETFSASTIEFDRENVDGQVYNVALLKRYMLIPQQEGKIYIDPAEIVCVVRVRSNNGGGTGSIFDEFFDNYSSIRKRISTGSMTVNVKPLPSGAPSSFEGGVGDFRISAALDNSSLNTNEAGSLKVTITGTGNISMLGAPKVVFPADFEAYDVKSSENIVSDGTSGTKTFEYPFIPRSYGSYSLGPINYSYFDIPSGKYVTISTPTLDLNVTASSEDSSSGNNMSSVARQGVRSIGEDIRYIAAGKDTLAKKGSFFVTSVSFYIIIALLIATFLIIDKLGTVARARKADVAGTRNRKANKIAKARLKQAGDYLSKGLETAFYEELHKAMEGYICDKLMLAPADYTKEKAGEMMVSRGVKPETADKFISIIDGCEMARYAPESDINAMEIQYQSSMTVISQIESSIGNNANKKDSAKKALMLIFLLSLSLSMSAQSWNEANDKYAQGDYTSALDSYLAIESSDMVSADLYYNIANCYFKLSNAPRAVLYYERALKLNPSHEDAANNLEIAKASVLDRIDEVPQFILAQWVEDCKYMLSSDGWAWVTIVLFSMVLLFTIGFRQLAKRKARKTSFALACVIFMFTLCSLAFSLSQRADALSEDSAVVLSPVSSVKSSPGNTGTSLFIIHEGTVVEIKDIVGDWYRVTIADGREGWIPAADIEMI